MVRGLQDYVNQNYEAKRQARGVQVYSPTRRLRPQGGMANAGTAGSILGGGPQAPAQQQTPRLRFPGIPGSLPGINYTPPGPGQPLPVPGGGTGSFLEQMAGQAPQQQEQPGGLSGFLGTVVNSLPGRAAMAALDVLDRPRRAVVSTIQEVADAINGGDASFNDWWDQFNDPTFGFGSVVGSTGNIWADRFIGFAGDVLLDPLTYVGGSSAISGTGRSMRIGAATRALAKTGEEELAQRLGRFGWSSVNREQRAMLREAANETILDPGYYFKLPFAERMGIAPATQGRLRIPGTGGLEQGVARTFAGARAGFNETRTGQLFRYISSRGGLEDAITKVVTGKGPMDFTVAAETIRYQNAAKRAGPAAVARLNALGRQMLDEHGREAMQAGFREAQETGTGVFADWTKAALKIMGDYGLEPPRGPRANYAPFVYTEPGKQWFNGPDGLAKAMRSYFFKDVDLDEIPVHLMPRTMVPKADGSPFVFDVGGKKYTFNIKSGTIDEWNSEFARNVPDAGFKLIDDDVESVMASYAKSLEDGIGMIAGAQSLLSSKSRLLRRGDDSEVTQLVVSEALTKMANQAKKKQLKIQLKLASETVKNLRDDVMKAISGTDGILGVHMRKALEEVTSLTARRKAELDQLFKEDQKLSKQRGIASLDGKVEGVAESKLERELRKDLDALDKRFDELQAELLRTRHRAAREMPIWDEAKQHAREMGQIAKIPQQLKALKKWQELYEEAAALAMDRETIATLHSRVSTNRARIALIDDRLRDNAWLHATAQHRIKWDNEAEPVFPDPRSAAEHRFTIPPEYDAQGKVITPRRMKRISDVAEVEETEAESTLGVRLSSQRARLGVFGGLITNPRHPAFGKQASPLVQSWDLAIREKITELYRAERDLALVANTASPQIQVAKDAFETMRRREVEMDSMIRQMRGRPYQRARRQAMQDQLDALRAPDGDLALARTAYQEMQKPIKAAEERVAHVRRQLDELRERQTQAFLAEAKRIPPGSIRLPMTAEAEDAARTQLRRAEGRLARFDESDAGRLLVEGGEELRRIDQTLGTGQRYEIPNPEYVAGAERQQLAARLTELRGYETGRFRGPSADAFRREAEDIRRRLEIAPTIKEYPIGGRIRELAELVNSPFRVDRGKVRWRNKNLQRIETLLERRPTRTGAALTKLDNELRKLNYRPDAWQTTLRQREELVGLIAQREGLMTRRLQLLREGRSAHNRRAKLAEQVARRQAPLDVQDRARQTIRNRLEESTPEYEGRIRGQLMDIQQREEADAAAALDNMLNSGVKIRWEGVPPMRPPDPLPFSFHERRILDWAYDQIQNYEHGVTDAGRVATAREQRALLDELDRVLRPVDDEARAAAEMELGDTNRILDEIKLSRTPMAVPTKGTALHDILIKRTHEVGEKGGATDIVSRAHASVHAAEVMDQQHGDWLIQNGAIFPGDIRDMRTMVADLNTKLDQYARSPQPNVRQQIEQLTADVSRYASFLNTYKHVLQTEQIKASDPLAAFILSRELLKERNVLNEQIRKFEALGKNDFERGIARNHGIVLDKLRTKINQASAAIDLQRKNALEGLEYDADLVKRETARRSRLRQRLNKLEEQGPPELGVMTEEIDTIVDLVTRYFIDLDNATADYNDARHITWAAGQTRRKLEEIEGMMPLLHAQTEQMRLSHQSLNQGIEEAKARGDAMVTFRRWEKGAPFDISVEEAERLLTEPMRSLLPPQYHAELERRTRAARTKIERAGGWRTGAGGSKEVTYKIRMPDIRAGRARQIRMEDLSVEEMEQMLPALDLTLEEAETVLPEYPREVQEQLRRRLSDFKKRRDRERSIVDRTRVTLPTSHVGDEQQIPLAVAEELAYKNRNVVTNMENALRNMDIQRSIILETAPEELANLRILINDFRKRPNAKVLKKDKAEIINRANAGGRELTPHEQAAVDFIDKRLDFREKVARGAITPDVMTEMMDRKKRLEQGIESFRQLGDARAAIVSIADNGNKLFDDLVHGRRDVTHEDLELMKELLGGEGGPHAETWIRTINDALRPGGTREISAGTEVDKWGREVPKVRISSEALEAMFAEITTIHGDTNIGNNIADRLLGLAADGEVSTAAEQAVREEIHRALVAAAQTERTERIRDVGDIIDLLGMDFFMTGPQGNLARVFPTLSEKMSYLGYSQSRSTFDESKLRLRIIEQLERNGYDPKRGLEQRLNEMYMRKQRLDTMRRGLGIHTRIAAPNDPQNLYRFLHQNLLYNEAEDLTRIVAAAPELVQEGLRLQTMAMEPGEARRLREQLGPQIAAGKPQMIMDLSTEAGWDRAKLAVNERLRNAIASQDEEAINEAELLLDALRRVQPNKRTEIERARVEELWQKIADRIDEDNPVFMAEDAALFNRLMVPKEMEEAWLSTGAGLRDDLAAAVEAGNDEEVERLTRMIEDHELGAPVSILEPVPDEPLVPPPTPEGPGTSTPPPAKSKRRLSKPAIFPVDSGHMAPPRPVEGYVDGKGVLLPDPVGPIPTYTDGRRTLFADPAPRQSGWTIRMLELDPNTRRHKSVALQGHAYATAEEASAAIENLRPGEIWMVGDEPPPAIVAAVTEPPAEVAPAAAAPAPAGEALPPPPEAGPGPVDLPPPEPLPPQALPPGEETTRPAVSSAEQQRLLGVVNDANSRAAQLRAQLKGLEADSGEALGPRVSDPLDELDTMAGETKAPPGSFSQADVERVRIRVMQLKMQPNRTPEDNAALTELSMRMITMMDKPWHAEPPALKDRAQALADQWDEMFEEGADAAETPTLAAAEQARLADELRKAEAEAAQAQAQLDSLDQPQMGTGAPESAAPTMIDDPHAAMVDEGSAPEPGAPDEIPPQQHEQLDDYHLTDDELAQEHELITREFRNLWDKYGGFENAPPEVQTQMGMLSGRAKQLDRLQRLKVSPRLRNTPDWQRYENLTKPWVASIEMDWRNVLKGGSASVAVARTTLNLDPTTMKTGGRLTGAAEDRLAHVLSSTTGARSTLSGPMYRGGAATREMAARLRLEPMENLRQDLMAVRAQAAAQSAEDVARIGNLEDKITATEARVAAESQAAAASFMETPIVSDVDERAQAAAEGFHQAQRKTRVDMINVNLAKAKREAEYTQKLKQIDMQLADVRSKIGHMQTDLASRMKEKQLLEKALKGAPKTNGMSAHIMDLRQANSWRRQAALRAGSDPEEMKQVAATEDLLDIAARAQIELDKQELNYDFIKNRLDAIAMDPGGFEPVMTRMIVDGWKPIAAQLLKMDDGGPAIIAANALANAITNVSQAWARPEPWKLVDKYTAFFKTYATARPGFHVRNALSAVFMNLVDGVRLGEIASAPATWREFMRNPVTFWDKAAGNVLNPNTGHTMADALNVVFGSGSGGQFLERGVGGVGIGAGSKMYQRLMNNRITRWNRRWGSAVEGTQRLAMAVDGLRKGMTVDAVLDRVEKFHFNYNDISAFDRSAKRLIPFWTFMSRNLPLQIEQMWLRPRTYLQYQSFVRNFAEENNPYVPEYWLMQGAFTMDQNAENAKGDDAPWYLAPDLPHLRVGEDVSALASGDLGKAVLSGINPLFLAPAEAYGFGKKVYTGAPISEEYVEPQGAMKALIPLLKMLGQTEETGSGGQAIDARVAHVLRSTLPPVDLLERLASDEGVRAGRQDETFYRQFLGLPVYQQTPEIRQSTRRTQYYDRLDESARRQQLARM